MAIVKGGLQVTGSIKGVSFYTVRGNDKVIMRTKGGASKEKIKNSPKFEGLRKQQKEWGGCARFGSIVRYAFGGLHRIADYNLTPVLNGIGKNLMKLDSEGETGRRKLALSTYPQALDGFNFNRNYPFNTVFRVSPIVRVDKPTLSAVVDVPRINAPNDLYNLQKLPYFRLLVAVGLVADLAFNEEHKHYEALEPLWHGISQTFTGEWMSTRTVADPQSIRISISANTDEVPAGLSMLVSMAVEFGQTGFTGQPEAVKYAGSGKVMVCV